MDFIHCLVPDLRKITNCGFYWGKMDRYEAERLLEGKPEGEIGIRLIGEIWIFNENIVECSQVHFCFVILRKKSSYSPCLSENTDDHSMRELSNLITNLGNS